MALQAYSLARDGSTALSPHFCVREFRCKDGSDPVFIDTALAELLERIREEKQRLIKEGKIKKDKHESVIFRRDNSHYEKLDGVERCIDDELPFEIPESWAWVRWGSIAESIQYGYNAPAKQESQHRAVIEKPDPNEH